MSDEWKWNESSKNAFDKIAGFFNVNPIDLVNATDRETKSILKRADESEIQIKRVQDAVQGYKRLWRNQQRIATQVHGLVRNGLQVLLQQRRQEAQTTKEHAKIVTETRVLSAKTSTDIKKTYLKGGKKIEKIGKDLTRYTNDLDVQYQVLDEGANQQSQQRQTTYRERAQKRLKASQRPWRDY